MTRALVAMGRTSEGVLVVGYQPRNSTGDVASEIEAAAEELGDQAFAFFAEKVKNEIPTILEANKVALRETAAEGIREGLARSNVGEQLAAARRSLMIGLATSTIIGIVGTAVLTSLLTSRG
jgi:hypothetical protein